MKTIFYDYKRTINGKSEIMYRGKWYTVLYTDPEYIIIRLRGKYTKLDKYDIEDCKYNNTIEYVDDNGNECIRLRVNSELRDAIHDGEMNILCNYDLDEIEACKNDMELYKTSNFKLFFLSGMLTNVVSNSDNVVLYEQFNRFVFMISNLLNGDNRRGINICIVDSFDSKYFRAINAILDKYAIYTDKDAIRCLMFKFVIDLLYIIEGEYDGT